MRALLQRVLWANVVVAGSEIGSIDQGILILLGIRKGDQEADADFLVRKISGLRIFEDDSGKMNLGLQDIGGEALIISQFTLYADTRKGRRPAFTEAEDPKRAEELYQYFVRNMEQSGIPVATGQFGADMAVSLQNQGPVTILIDSPGPGDA